METIRGKTSLAMDLTELTERLMNYNRITLDLGTGDGKFAFHHADKSPDDFVIGLDACRENLHEYSRAKLPNLLYVIANAQNLPCELHGLISHITINFPWGSLLESLLIGDAKLICGLNSVAQFNTTIDIRLNGGAMSEAGTALEIGAIQIQERMREAGWQIKKPSLINNVDLKKYPTTWARRIAVGRDPRAMLLSGYVG